LTNSNRIVEDRKIFLCKYYTTPILKKQTSPTEFAVKNSEIRKNGRIYDEDFAEIQNGQREIFNALTSVLKYFAREINIF